MSREVKNKSLLYHLTDIRNLDSIFANGLISRASLNRSKHDYISIADSEIIDRRHSCFLEHYVPFHFFAKNPFAGAVQKQHSNKFVFVSIKRNLAKEMNCKILTKHPLTLIKEGALIFYDYEEGFNLIDWQKMETGDYCDEECRLICMAECLVLDRVPANNISQIFTKTPGDEKEVNIQKMRYNLKCRIACNEKMFI